MVNICGHSLCENCVNMYFVRGSGECLQCHIILRRNNFRDQVFEDAEVEKDTDIRKRVIRDFNKKEEDFQTLREYNDYLEQVETIVFNLTNGIDVEQTKLEIEAYKRENQDNIKKNKAKLSHDEELIEMLLEQERAERQLHQQQVLEVEQHLRQEKQKQKNELIDDLMFSNLPAEHIIKTHRKDVTTNNEKSQPSPAQKPSKFITNLLPPKQDRFYPVRMETGTLYSHAPLHLDYNGPTPPSIDELGRSRYLMHIRQENETEKAGGFLSDIACYRALVDSFCGLYY